MSNGECVRCSCVRSARACIDCWPLRQSTQRCENLVTRITALGEGQECDHIKQFHQHVNSIEASIQFTVEEKSNGSIPFLDTKIIRHDDASLSTTVFRKQTHTDRYLDFASHTRLQWSELCGKNLHLHHWHGRRKGACHQSPQQQWLPKGDCRPEPAPYIPPDLPPTWAGNT